MRFFIYRVDKPGHEELRMATRPAHLDYARGLGDKLVLAGPTFTEDGKTMNGSVFLLEAKNREDAETITAADPYEKVGLFESKIIRPFLQTMPE
ncbi:MAG: YciI family protein [Proteobacteria bacterium]|nr:YciI family protein [Pseudomonadota bacterium]